MPPSDEQARAERDKPETFDFLGFTHICGKSGQGSSCCSGARCTKRMRAKLRAIREELRRRRHLPVPSRGDGCGSVVRGYFAYHAVPTNVSRLGSFRTQVARHWQQVASAAKPARPDELGARMNRLDRTMASASPHPASLALGPL